MKSLGDRIKNNYENRSKHFLTRRTPVIIRVDGRAFHTLLRHAEKPFSLQVKAAMMGAATDVANDMQGFKLGYHQSDEVSFLITDYDDLNTEAYFNYNKSKIESIVAATMSVAFSDYHGERGIFDARAFNLPESEVANYFLWRAKDWERNSLSMYCRAFFSHRELIGKNMQQQHDMLHKIGKNWTTDVSDEFKNGTFLTISDWHHNIKPTHEEISTIVNAMLVRYDDNSRR